MYCPCALQEVAELMFKHPPHLHPQNSQWEFMEASRDFFTELSCLKTSLPKYVKHGGGSKLSADFQLTSLKVIGNVYWLREV